MRETVEAIHAALVIYRKALDEGDWKIPARPAGEAGIPQIQLSIGK